MELMPLVKLLTYIFARSVLFVHYTMYNIMQEAYI